MCGCRVKPTKETSAKWWFGHVPLWKDHHTMESFALVGREYPRSDFLSPAEATHTPMAPKNCGMKFKVDYGTN
jgi:hypothetical protein